MNDINEFIKTAVSNVRALESPYTCNRHEKLYKEKNFQKLFQHGYIDDRGICYDYPKTLTEINRYMLNLIKHIELVAINFEYKSISINYYPFFDNPKHKQLLRVSIKTYPSKLYPKHVGARYNYLIKIKYNKSRENFICKVCFIDKAYDRELKNLSWIDSYDNYKIITFMFLPCFKRDIYIEKLQYYIRYPMYEYVLSGSDPFKVTDLFGGSCTLSEEECVEATNNILDKDIINKYCHLLENNLDQYFNNKSDSYLRATEIILKKEEISVKNMHAIIFYTTGITIDAVILLFNTPALNCMGNLKLKNHKFNKIMRKFEQRLLDKNNISQVRPVIVKTLDINDIKQDSTKQNAYFIGRVIKYLY